MNKKLLLLTLPAVLLVGWCFGTQTDTVSDDTSSLSWTTVMDTSTTLAQCKAAVATYLDSQKDVKIDESQKVQSGNLIVVDYIGRLADGSVFDTSIESVAKGCDLYNAARDYSTGLEFTGWAGQVVAGFDEGVMGMSLNETKTIEMSAYKAYGGETVVYPKEAFSPKPDGSDYKAGESFMTMQGQIDIISVSDAGIEIKNPSPLGGKDLIFDVTVKSIK